MLITTKAVHVRATRPTVLKCVGIHLQWFNSFFVYRALVFESDNGRQNLAEYYLVARTCHDCKNIRIINIWILRNAFCLQDFLCSQRYTLPGSPYGPACRVFDE